jgi:hypothetical protein
MVGPEVCSKCNIKIHAKYSGRHKCGYNNCPICKKPVPPAIYEKHILSHHDFPYTWQERYKYMSIRPGEQEKYKTTSYIETEVKPKSKPKDKYVSVGSRSKSRPIEYTRDWGSHKQEHPL